MPLPVRLFYPNTILTNIIADCQDFEGPDFLEYSNEYTDSDGRNGDPILFPNSVNAPSRHLVVLYDASRRMYVKLTDTEAFFKWIPEGDSFEQHEWTVIPQNPTGYWESDTKFIDETGFFEEVDTENWIEQQGEETNYFTRVSEEVVLYDEFRSMYVKLTSNKAYYKWIPEGETFEDAEWTLIPQNPTGHWVSNTKFVEKTGYFEQVDANNWIEQQADGTHYYTRVTESVVLYDESRSIYVKLTDAKAYFKWIPMDDTFYDYEWVLIPQNPTGHWVSSTKFVEKTGYFEQVDANNWIEQQGEDRFHFVRISGAADSDE